MRSVQVSIMFFYCLSSSLFIVLGLNIVCFQSEDVRPGAGFMEIHAIKEEHTSLWWHLYNIKRVP